MYLVDSVIHTSNNRSQVYKKGICQQIFKGNMAGLVQKIIFISDILALFTILFSVFILIADFSQIQRQIGNLVLSPFFFYKPVRKDGD